MIWYSRRLMPRSSASEGAFTSLTGSSVRPSSAPLRTCTVTRRVSRSAIRPRYSTAMASIDVPSASAVPIRPSAWARPRKGPRASRSSPPTAGTFTAVVTTPPVRAARTCSAAWKPARSVASAVEAPRCGVTTTFG